MEEKKEMLHKLTMENREKLFICGVEDVESFDENEIIVYTSEGTLGIKGSSLHINKLNTDNGELMIDGNIDSLVYSNTQSNQGGFLSKLFR
jgi:sporulation protein YabP